jgi:hypothetical protein
LTIKKVGSTREIKLNEKEKKERARQTEKKRTKKESDLVVRGVPRILPGGMHIFG